MFLYPTHRVSIRRRPLKLVVIKVIVNINAKIPHQGLKWIQALCVMPSMRMNVKPARLPKRINQHIPDTASFPRRIRHHALTSQEFSPTLFTRTPEKNGHTSNSGLLLVTISFWGGLIGVFRNKQIDNQNIKYHEN